MKTISVLRLLDVVPVSTMQEAVGVHPRSIIVDGQDFTTVESVLINGSMAPEVAVLTPTRLLAQVPEDQVQATITDVSVLSANLTLTDRSIVEFTLGTRIKSVSGVQRLMQVFLRHMLRSPGSNIFHPRSGGGLRKRVGTIFDDSVTADVALAVSSTRQYIISAQSSDRTIPPSERLMSAEIVGMRPVVEAGSLFVTVSLRNHSGQTGAASMLT
jgi:hypothetical protein